MSDWLFDENAKDQFEAVPLFPDSVGGMHAPNFLYNLWTSQLPPEAEDSFRGSFECVKGKILRANRLFDKQTVQGAVQERV